MAKRGRPIGTKNSKDRRLTDKPFAEALRLEILDAGTDNKRLRRIAAALIRKAEEGDLQAIQQVADRLDGKPAQEQNVNVNDKRDAFDWSRAEIERRLAESFRRDANAGNVASNGRNGSSDSVH